VNYHQNSPLAKGLPHQQKKNVNGNQYPNWEFLYCFFLNENIENGFAFYI
jgi:hypothetical protein